MQNIGAANSDDAFYRYKMPRMITKIEGRGNGIKTNIVNMVDIAKALARPASYTTKYFGCELGAQSKFDEKNGVSLVNGAHNTAKLAELLEAFIKKYVQCYGCRNPETEVLISKNQTINLKCAACGFISDVSMTDKLATFILRNPPEQKKSSKDKKAMRRAEKERLKEGQAADEEQKKSKKDSKKKSNGSAKDASIKAGVPKKKGNSSDEDRPSPPQSLTDVNEDEGDDDVQWQTDTSNEAALRRIKEQLSDATAEMVMLSTKETDKKIKSGKVNREMNQTTDAIATLVNEIKSNLKKGATPQQLPSIIASFSPKRHDIFPALFAALFADVGKGLSKEIEKKKKYLIALVESEGSDSQILLLGAVESFCLKTGSDAVKEIALIVKAMYDGDVLEEEHIIQWYMNGLSGDNKNHLIWKNMKPLVEWLQNAESESEED